jgi:hypothetical protein
MWMLLGIQGDFPLKRFGTLPRQVPQCSIDRFLAVTGRDKLVLPVACCLEIDVANLENPVYSYYQMITLTRADDHG